MPLVIILAAVPGSGKTTVLDETVKLLPELKVINYGDMMLKEAALQHIDKDLLRKLPFSEQQQFGILAARKMAANMPEIACIDTHAMIKTPYGYVPGIPEEVIRELRPQAIGMIECSPSQILERGKKDSSRRRDDDNLEQIEYHQQLSRSFLLACCALSGALFAPIQNCSDPLEGAKHLTAIIESYKR